MASEIRVNKINNRAGLGTITIADTGVVVNGIVTCTEVSGLNVLNIAGVSTFASTLDINGDIDVDGHTNLDNVSIAGVTTMNAALNIVSAQPLIYLNNTSFESDYQVQNLGGTFTVRDVDRGDNVFQIGKTGLSTFSGRLDVQNNVTLDRDLDVDGHTNLDNVSVAGVTTFSDNITLNGGLVASSSVTAGQILVGSGVTIESNQVATGQATFTGIVTASSFRGDGSQLTGISAGPGTGESYVIYRNQSNPPALSDTGRNIIIGYNAAHKYGNGSATGGNENVFLGYGAGYNQTGGDGNVYVGAGAGNANVTSTGSVYIGQDSGRFATGGDNICIGRFAGNVGGFTGTNNLVFGFNSDPSSANVSNEITLGNTNISHFRIPGIGLSFGNNGAVIAGVVTATSFSGDGSSLSNLPAGAPVGGASTNTVFFENDKEVAVNYQITSTKNAMTAGPVAINAGIAVTVPSGCAWTIV